MEDANELVQITRSFLCQIQGTWRVARPRGMRSRIAGLLVAEECFWAHCAIGYLADLSRLGRMQACVEKTNEEVVQTTMAVYRS